MSLIFFSRVDLHDDRVAREWISEETMAESLRETIKGFTFTIFFPSRAKGQEDAAGDARWKGSRGTRPRGGSHSADYPLSFSSVPLDSDPFESPSVGIRRDAPAEGRFYTPRLGRKQNLAYSSGFTRRANRMHVVAGATWFRRWGELFNEQQRCTILLGARVLWRRRSERSREPDDGPKDPRNSEKALFEFRWIGRLPIILWTSGIFVGHNFPIDRSEVD